MQPRVNEECLDSKWKCIALKSGCMPFKIKQCINFVFLYIIKYDTYLIVQKYTMVQ